MRKILFIIPFFLWTCGGFDDTKRKDKKPLSEEQFENLLGAERREKEEEHKKMLDEVGRQAIIKKNEQKQKVKDFNNFFETDVVSLKNLNAFLYVEHFLDMNGISFWTLDDVPSKTLDGGIFKENPLYDYQNNEEGLFKIIPPSPYFIGTKKWSKKSKKIFKAKVTQEYIPLYDRDYKNRFIVKLESTSGEKYNLRFSSSKKYFNKQRENIKNGFIFIKNIKYKIPDEYRSVNKKTYEQFKGIVNYYGNQTNKLRRKYFFNSVGELVLISTYNSDGETVVQQRYSKLNPISKERWNFFMMNNDKREVILIYIDNLENEDIFLSLNFHNNNLYTMSEAIDMSGPTHTEIYKNGKTMSISKKDLNTGNNLYVPYNGFKPGKIILEEGLTPYAYIEKEMHNHQWEVDQIVNELKTH